MTSWKTLSLTVSDRKSLLVLCLLRHKFISKITLCKTVALVAATKTILDMGVRSRQPNNAKDTIILVIQAFATRRTDSSITCKMVVGVATYITEVNNFILRTHYIDNKYIYYQRVLYCRHIKKMQKIYISLYHHSTH